MFSKAMKKNKAFTISVIGLSIILLVIGFFLWKSQSNSNIKVFNSFEDCAKAGYPIMESFPEQCRVPGGKTFTKQVSEQSNWQEETIEEIGLTLKHPKIQEDIERYHRLKTQVLYQEFIDGHLAEFNRIPQTSADKNEMTKSYLSHILQVGTAEERQEALSFIKTKFILSKRAITIQK